MNAVPLVSDNPWFLCSLRMTVRLLAAGLAWGWLFAPGRGSFARRALLAAAVTAVLGVLLSSLVALALGLAGLYAKAWLEAATLAAVTLAGLALGWWRDRARVAAFARCAWPGALGLAALVAAVMLAPARGEWIVGGWDPGVYVNEGVALERTGTFQPADRLFRTQLSRDERRLFIRQMFNRRERFPGIVAANGKSAFEFEFFRLMPSWVAVLQRCGGLRAATRVNDFTALLGAVAFAAFLFRALRPPQAAFALAALVIQPVWLYHMHTPVSEMLELLLLAGLALAVARREESPRAAALTAALLLALVLNRFTFVAFGGFFLLALTWIELDRPDRRAALRERAIQGAALAAGVAVDFAVAPLSLGGWGGVLPRLLAAGGAASGLALLAEILLLNGRFRDRVASLRARVPAWPRWVGAGLVAAAFVGLYLGVRLYTPAQFREDLDNVFRLVPYAGYGVTILAVAGGFVVLARRAGVPRAAKGLLLFLLALTAIVLARKHIFDIYPWATRRYLPCAVPLAAILAGCALAALWELRGRWSLPGRALAAGLFLMAVLTPGGRLRAAVRVTEYDGLSAQLAALAERIGPDELALVDHPWWGTPLTFVYGRPCLNGAALWESPDAPARCVRARSLLERLARQGVPVKLVTCGEDGLGIYGGGMGPASLVYESPAIALAVVGHGSRQRHIEREERTFRFRLYTLKEDRR